MMLSCKETTVIVSQSLDRKLSLRERINVKLHLLICNACRRMVKQMKLIRALSRRHHTPVDSGTELQHLSEAATTRIRERLDRELQGHSGQNDS